MLLADQETHCPLHRQALLEDTVLIMYGLIRYEDDYAAARKALFSRSKFFVLGGCVRDDELWYKVMYCPACRENHLSWCAANNRTDGLPPTQAEVDMAIRRQFGNTNFSGFMSPEVEKHISQGEKIAAIKALKMTNPDIEISELREYFLYRQKKAAYEKATGHGQKS